MTLFWLLIFSLTILALGFILIPLLRISRRNQINPTKLQISLYREQLQNLKIQFKKNEISAGDFKQSKQELEGSLLDHANEMSSPLQIRSSYTTALLFIFLFPAIALLFYLHWGNSAALSQWLYVKQHKAQINAEITKLGSTQNIIKAMQARLQQEPSSIKGWYLLGKLYFSQRQFSNAASAFAKAYVLQPNNPEIMQYYAESLFFNNQAQLNTQIKGLLNKVLVLQPMNPDAINLYAIGSYRAGDYQNAVTYWEKLLPLFPLDSTDGKTLLMMIAQAQKHLSAVALPIKISIKVILAEKLIAAVNPDETLFIYAKAVSGPVMPLAVIRKQVKDLPLVTLLTPADAMVSAVTLANFQQVKVFARISKSGQVMPQAGDLQGESGIIDVRQKRPVVVVINQIM